MPDIVLTTQNAKWIHASFGLRCLRANLGELRPRSVILEHDLQQRPADVVEAILAHQPRIVGLGVYVWNATQSLHVAQLLKRIRPDVVLVLGGPEVSYETEGQAITPLADYIVRGEADLAFAELCRQVLDGNPPQTKILDAPLPRFEQLAWPYAEYDATDIGHRIVYVEASRGCPFTCEFCLSALDIPVRQAPLAGFLAQLAELWGRGVRHFKFVDRTFNLKIKTAEQILAWFLARLQPNLLLHFELIPDRLPDELRAAIAAFPPGTLQFEVGIQTLDPEVSARISRRQDVGALEANLRWLRACTGAHVHADLIAGLPGEDLATFAAGFDRLWRLRPHEIQIGILKRLRGTPIVRHEAAFGLVYAPQPPYEIIQTSALSFLELQRVKRAARFFDLVVNSGRFPATSELVLAGASPFAAFLACSDWLYATTKATHGIAAHRLAELLLEFLTSVRGEPRAGQALAADYAAVAPHEWPEALRPWIDAAKRAVPRRSLHPAARRQARRSVSE